MSSALNTNNAGMPFCGCVIHVTRQFSSNEAARSGLGQLSAKNQFWARAKATKACRGALRSAEHVKNSLENQALRNDDEAAAVLDGVNGFARRILSTLRPCFSRALAASREGNLAERRL